jgi:hypothetical protein
MKKTMVSFVAVLLVVSLFSACGSDNSGESNSLTSPGDAGLTKKSGDEIAERMVGGDDYYVDIDLEAEEGGEGISWPGNIPSEYPKFPSGKIEIVMGDLYSDEEAVMLQYIEIGGGEIEKYFEELENLGWGVEENKMDGVVLGYVARKGDMEISIDIDPIGPGTAFLLLAK